MSVTADRSIPQNNQSISTAEWQSLAGSWRSDGVYRGLFSELAVTERGAGANMSVDVAAGVVIARGVEATWSTTSNIAIASNGSGNPRIDIIVARMTVATGNTVLDVVQGTPAVSPTEPSATANATMKEIPLAAVTVASAAVSIVNANIADRRTPSSGPGGARAWTMTAASTLPYRYDPDHPSDITLPITGATIISAIPVAPAGSILRLEAMSTMTVIVSATLGLTAAFNGVASGAPLTRSVLTLASDGTAWIEIGRAGFATLTIACRAFNIANIPITTAVTTALPMDSERYDTQNLHSTAVNTSRITFPVAGAYQVFGNARFAANATGIRSLQIRLNAGTFIASSVVDNAGAGTDVELNVNTTYNFAASDYVELWALQTSGGNLDIVAVSATSPEFGATYLGRIT